MRAKETVFKPILCRKLQNLTTKIIGKNKKLFLKEFVVFLWYTYFVLRFLQSNNNHQTLGFVIAGGTDTPYFDHPHFTYIIIVDIIENSIAYNDKRLK